MANYFDQFDAQMGVNGGQPFLSDAEVGIPQPYTGSTIADAAKSGGIGLVKGAIGLAGTPGMIGDAARAATTWAGDVAGLNPNTIKQFEDRVSTIAGLTPLLQPFTGPNAQDITRDVERLTGPLYSPKTTAGDYAQTVGEFAPAALAGPGSLAKRLVTQTIVPGLTSEALGQATKGTDSEPVARAIGAMAGAALPSIASRVVSPIAASAGRDVAVQTLTNEGVPLTAGQRTGSRSLQYAESALGDAPFSGGSASKVMSNQAEAFTAAALNRIGEDATRATPEVIDRAFDRIGGVFNRVAQNNTIPLDQRLLGDLSDAWSNYSSVVAPSQMAPVVKNMIGDVLDMAGKNNGQLSGAAYQAMRTKLGQVLRSTTSPELKQAVGDIQSALDDALARNASPNDLAAINQARQQYRNLMVIQRAATGAGSQTAEGLISPSQLRNAVVNQSRRAYARGQGDFADLARAGETALKPLPQSGTAPRLTASAVPAVIGSLLGSMIDGGAGIGLTAGGTAGLAVPGVAGRMLMSRPVQAYLGNQLAVPFRNSLATRANMLGQLGYSSMLNTVPGAY
jgi:hypothetical protein